jgi:hypothetical protein
MMQCRYGWFASLVGELRDVQWSPFEVFRPYVQVNQLFLGFSDKS